MDLVVVAFSSLVLGLLGLTSDLAALDNARQMQLDLVRLRMDVICLLVASASPSQRRKV